MAVEPYYLMFWGKARGAREGEPATHPVAYHGLDVAAAANALLEAQPRILSRMAQLLGTTPCNARRLLVMLMALHDIGKFADAFQRQVPEAWPKAVLGKYSSAIPPRHHTIVALDLRERLDLRGLLKPAFDAPAWRDRAIYALWVGIACHHGRPMDGASEIGDGFPLEGIGRKGEEAAKAFARDAVNLLNTVLGPIEPLQAPQRYERKIEILSWLVAGLTNLADWIGSARDAFNYHEATLSLEDYWPIAQARAREALKRTGILPLQSAPCPRLPDLFPSISTKQASPLQAWAQSVELPQGPMLAIVEDVTGSGKTEAALLLAARLMADDRAGGLFFALPTMATANAMFDRLRDAYRRLFADSAPPSLALAHGRSGLHPGFTQSILDNVRPIGPREASGRGEDNNQGDESSATCAAWIADDRRKAFLAHVGVGTIDQAFLGVLPAKHQALRLWGLADRVLIVDEAHAYDAYMGRELERLLEFHAALGGSAIVLSATLPSAQRGRLVTAYAKGLGAKISPPTDDSYPLVTMVSAGAAVAVPVQTRSDRERGLSVCALEPNLEAVARRVADMAGRGAAVAWIRNAVDDAMEAAEALRRTGRQPVLLHSRFAMGDRLDIEANVRETLGRTGDPARREGFIVVGTQILQESLDYDVDAMVTDLAPIDLIIQRAGRLWRHSDRARPISLKPELLVVTPDWQAVTSPDWYRQVSARAAAVYKHHCEVWRSAKALFPNGIATPGTIETPGDGSPGGVRALIEAVYGPADNADVPEPLRLSANEAEGQSKAFRSVATANLLELGAGYAGNNAIWTDEDIVPTRLGEPVTVFRLGRIVDGTLVPWCHDADLRRAWALSEVSIRKALATGVPEPADDAKKALIETAMADWPEFERNQPLLILTEGPQGATGQILGSSREPQTVVYDRKTGLRMVART